MDLVFPMKSMELTHPVKFFETAGITFEVRSDYPILEGTFHPKFRRFEVPGKGEDTIRIYHHFHPPGREAFPLEKVEIYKKDPWRIFRSPQSWIYRYTSIFPGDLVKSVSGIMDSSYTNIHIYAPDLEPEKYGCGNFSALTLFNTDQMIFAKLLSDRHGLMVHANGFRINGNGLLLAGISGSGKSTLSAMLKQKGHEILCDDRMLIRKMDDRFQIFGNWCYGSHPDVSPGKAPLQCVAFLKKGKDNRLNRLTRQADIVLRLMQVLVKPLLEVAGWEKYLKTLAELQKTVSFYEIEFDLSGRICEVLSGHFHG